MRTQFHRHIEVEEGYDTALVRFVIHRPEDALEHLSAEWPVSESRFGRVFVDLGGIGNLSSREISDLVALGYRLCRPEGRRVLYNVSPDLRDLLTTLRLSELFDFGLNSDGEELGGRSSLLEPPSPSGGACVSLQEPSPVREEQPHSVQALIGAALR